MSNYIFDYFDRKLVDFVKIVEFAIIDGNRNFTIFFHGTRLFYANYMKYFCRISRLFLDYFPTILLVETNTELYVNIWDCLCKQQKFHEERSHPVQTISLEIRETIYIRDGKKTYTSD